MRFLSTLAPKVGAPVRTLTPPRADTRRNPLSLVTVFVVSLVSSFVRIVSFLSSSSFVVTVVMVSEPSGFLTSTVVVFM